MKLSPQKAPPPQYLKPVPTRAAPMRKTVTPVTIGGNTLRRACARHLKKIVDVVRRVQKQGTVGELGFFGRVG